MSKEITIVSVGTLSMSVIEPGKEPHIIHFNVLGLHRNPINTKLQEELTRLYQEDFRIVTSNAFQGVQTYVLVRGE